MNSTRVAEFAAGLCVEKIPSAAVARAKLALRDTIGTMLGGERTTAARIAAEVAELEAPGDGAVLLTGRRRAGRPFAAFANAVAASALDYDDGHYLGGAGHPGAVIVPALLAVASGRNVSGADFLAAQVAAYEVAIRAGHLLWPKSDTHQYHTTGTMGCIGGAAGVARLLHLPPDALRSAIGIAWAQAPMAAFSMPMVKESIGWAACTAVMAGGMSAAGFRAGGAFASRPTGLLFDRPDAGEDPFVATLGQVFESERTYFKKYAACRYTHAAADAFRFIVDEQHLEPAAIKLVRVRTHRRALYLNDPNPSALEFAQYSFPFVLGALAAYAAAGPDEIAEARLDDPQILEFARRVQVDHEPSFDDEYPIHYGSEIEVTMLNGTQYVERRLKASGDPGTDFGEEQLHAKYMAMAVPALGARTANALSDLCGRIETAAVDDLLQLLAEKPERG